MSKPMSRLEFVSYDGRYPTLCMGKLVVKVDGKEVVFPDYCLASKGNCYFTDNYENEVITEGDWDVIDYPPDFPEELKNKLIEMVNNEVPHGCCGGCL